jgi:glycosyltransferase involved in cell wall biosynthesis
MRVLHVDTALSWRGGQNQVLLTARGMAARGQEVRLACRNGGALAERARAEGLSTVGVGFRGDLWPPGLATLAGVLRSFRPDVVQLHDPHAVSAGLLALRFAPGAAAVATRRVDFPLRGLLSRWKYASCGRVIAVSRAIADVLEGGGLPPDRIRVVYEGVPDRPPAQGGEEALRALGIPEGSPVIGNVAALTPHKDHETLIRAAALVLERVPEARFVILGEGELRSTLERQAAGLGLGDRCVFAGFRNDLDRLLPAFTLLCLSSRLEGLGTSLLDAMCFGVAIVATTAGGIPEAVEDGVTGTLVPPGDAAALARALLDLLENEGRRRALAAAARHRFEERFSAGRMVDETLRVYHEVAPAGR